MTNIDQLPTNIGDSLTYTVSTNSDFRWSIQFLWASGTQLAGQPLDITGIGFQAQMRSTVGDVGKLLEMSTQNGLIQVVSQLGQITFVVPRDRPTVAPYDHMLNLPEGPAVLDCLALADGKIINLCQTGPIQMTILRGVTRA